MPFLPDHAKNFHCHGFKKLISTSTSMYYEFAESLKIQKSLKKFCFGKYDDFFKQRKYFCNLFFVDFRVLYKIYILYCSIVKSEICTMRFDEDLQGKLLQQQLGWGLLETVVDTQLPSWLIDSRRFAYQTSPSLSNK